MALEASRCHYNFIVKYYMTSLFFSEMARVLTPFEVPQAGSHLTLLTQIFRRVAFTKSFGQVKADLQRNIFKNFI